MTLEVCARADEMVVQKLRISEAEQAGAGRGKGTNFFFQVKSGATSALRAGAIRLTGIRGPSTLMSLGLRSATKSQ